MLKRILTTWTVANLAIVGLVSWIVGEWYIGWCVSPAVGMLVELGLVMVPTTDLPLRRIFVPSFAPAGMGTVNLRRALLVPEPLQAGHGFSTIEPAPPQREQGWLSAKNPWL